MIVIGVTGGIASGKSTLAKMIAEHGYEHVDADKLVHQLLEQPEIVAQIRHHFPAAVEHEAINRHVLGALVSADKAALDMLEGILHPKVREAEIAAIENARKQGKKAIILDIPLLFESGADDMCDIVITATAPLALRKKRAMERAGMSEEKFARFIARQMDEETRNAKADYVIPTDGDIASTKQQLDVVLKQLNLLA